MFILFLDFFNITFSILTILSHYFMFFNIFVYCAKVATRFTFISLRHQSKFQSVSTVLRNLPFIICMFVFSVFMYTILLYFLILFNITIIINILYHSLYAYIFISIYVNFNFFTLTLQEENQLIVNPNNLLVS